MNAFKEFKRCAGCPGTEFMERVALVSARQGGDEFLQSPAVVQVALVLL